MPFERCEITELLLHKFQLLVDYNCFGAAEYYDFRSWPFCEFVCFLHCVHRVSWNDPSTYVCGRHILDVTLLCIAIIYCTKTSVQNPIDLFVINAQHLNSITCNYNTKLSLFDQIMPRSLFIRLSQLMKSWLFTY